MKPIQHSETTHVFNAPDTWREQDDGTCIALPVIVENRSYTSFWKLDADELAILMSGGCIALRVFGGQPPVMLSVSSIKEEDVNQLNMGIHFK